MTVVELPLQKVDDAAVVHANIRNDLGVALGCYLDAVTTVSREPLFSVLPLIRTYFLLLAWEIGLLLLPLIAVVNAAIWGVRKLRRAQTPPYVPAWGLSWSAQAVRSLHAGEIPLMKMVVNRNLVRIFALFHIRARMKHLATHVRAQYVRAVIDRDRLAIHEHDAERRVLDASSVLIQEKAELKLLLLAVPLLELLGKSSHVALSSDFSVSTAARRADVWLGFVEQAHAAPLARFEHLHHTFQIVTLTSYLLFVLISCFIRKRQIFADLGVYKAEAALRNKHSVWLPREIPLDLLGWVVVVLLATAPALFLRNGLDWRTFATFAAFYTAPFLYAVWRRLKLGTR